MDTEEMDEKEETEVFRQTIVALVQAMGMLSENLSRLSRGEAIAYPDICFFDLVTENKETIPSRELKGQGK